MIKAEEIKKSFGNLQVLKGINLEIAAGEVVSIVGASGAGIAGAVADFEKLLPWTVEL